MRGQAKCLVVVACALALLLCLGAWAGTQLGALAKVTRVGVIAPPGAIWTPVIGGATAAPPGLERVEATANLSKLRLRLPGFHQVPLTRAGMSFARLSLPDEGVSTEVGKPEVPIARRLVAIPDGATASVSVTTSSRRTFGNLLVFPAQRPVKDQASEAEVFDMDRAFYARDASYPEQIAKVSQPMMLGKQRVVLLEVAPMQYNPARGELTVNEDVEVKLEFSRPAASVAPTRAAVQRIGPSTVINADLIHAIASVGEKWDYLIIAADQFLEELEPLITWKRAKGLRVHLARISYVGNTPAQIESFVRNAFGDHDVRYVLLVGDVDTIAPYTASLSDGGTAPSDFKYSLVSGTDLLPDVAIGRFPARSEAEVTNMVDKTVNYEKNPMTPSLDWYKKAMFVSDTGVFEETSNTAASYLLANGYTVDKLYASSGNATTTNVANALNNGRAIVNYRGHGSPTGWSTSGFSTSNIAGLTNGRMTPVVFSITCSTGQFDYSSDSFAESWSKLYAGGPDGAVAVWAAARPSWRGPNNELDKGVYRALFDDDLRALGEVTNQAKLYCIGALGADAAVTDNLYLYNLFGDPSLTVRTEKPSLQLYRPTVNIMPLAR